MTNNWKESDKKREREYDTLRAIETSTLPHPLKLALVDYARHERPEDMPIRMEQDPAVVIGYLKKLRNGNYSGTYEGRPTHFSITNSSCHPVYCEVTAWGETLVSMTVAAGYAIIEKFGQYSGLTLAALGRSDWYPTDAGGNTDITHTSVASHVGSRGSADGLSLGPGFSSGDKGPIEMTVLIDGLSYITNTAYLQVPEGQHVAEGWQNRVISATVFESASSCGITDPLEACSDDVVEQIFELTENVEVPAGMSITLVWVLTLFKCLGARSYCFTPRGAKRVYKAFLFGALLATVIACTTNSECSPSICSFGSCRPLLPPGSLCEESADCLGCPCIEKVLPELGWYFFCQCPDPTRSATNTATPSRTPSRSATRSPVVPSLTSTGTATRTPSASVSTTANPTMSTTMTTLPSASPTQSATASIAVSPTASQTPTNALAASSSTTMTANPVASATGSSTSLPTSAMASASQTGVWTASPSMTAVQSFVASSAPTPLMPRPEMTEGAVAGHFEHQRQANITSGSSRVVPYGIFSLAVSAAEAARCIGSRLAKTMAEVQVSGVAINSTSGNYTYDKITYYGIEEPSLIGVYCNDSYLLLPDMVMAEHHSRSLKSLEVSSSPVFVYRDGNSLTLRFLDSQTRAVEINIDGIFWNMVTNNTLLYVSLPVKIFFYTVVVVVRTRIGPVIESENAFTIKGERPCIIEDCYFCNLLNWDCTPPLFRGMAILALILIGVCIIWVLLKSSVVILAIFKLGFNCSYYICGALWNVTKSQGLTLENWFRTNAARDVTRAVVILAMLSGTMACDDSFMVGSEHVTVTSDGAVTTAEISLDYAVSIRGFGSVVCLLYQVDGKPFATMEIKSTSNSIECDLVNPYYTSAFEVYAMSSFRCNGAGPCPGDCDGEAPRDAYGEFNSTNWLSYPGETRCTRRCSGIACGCLLPAAGCVYTTYSVLPKNPAARVSEVSVCNRNPSFYYTVKDSSGELVSSGEIDTLSEIGENGDYTFEILTQTPVDIPEDFPSHLIQTHGTSVLWDAAKRGQPRYGMPGDIQADTVDLLRDGNFTYDPRVIARFDEKTKHDKIVSNPPGIYAINEAKGLPAVIGRSVWSTNTDSSTWASKIVSYDSGYSPSLVSVRSKGSLTVTRIVNIVCPVVVFEGLAGCRECSGGATATFTVSSKCLSGTVTSSGGGSVISHVYMDSTPRKVDIVFRSNDEDYSETWEFGEVEVDVEGHLELAIELGQTTLLYNGTEKQKAHEGFRVGNWTWWEYSLFGVACLLLIVVFGGVVLACVGPSLFAMYKGWGVVKEVMPTKVEPEVLNNRQETSGESLRRRLLRR